MMEWFEYIICMPFRLGFQGGWSDHPDGAKEPVSSVMTPWESVLHVSLTDPASKVIDLFFNKNVRHLPVIDNRAHLAGIISVRDLLRPLINGD